MLTNIDTTKTRRKHHAISLQSPFDGAREAKVRWIGNPGPHANDDLTRWLEAECGISVSGGRR